MTKKTLVWIFGIALWIFLFWSLTTLSDKLGFKTLSVDNEENNILTLLGYWNFIVSIMISSRICLSIYHWKIDGNLSYSEKLEYNLWLIGGTLYSFLSSIMSKYFDKIQFVRIEYVEPLMNFLYVVLLVFVGIFIYFFFKKIYFEKYSKHIGFKLWLVKDDDSKNLTYLIEARKKEDAINYLYAIIRCKNPPQGEETSDPFNVIRSANLTLLKVYRKK